MRKLMLTATVALVVLAAAAGTASAFTATVSRGGAISSASLGDLSFTGGVFTIRCPVTLNGSLLTGPITLARGERIGSISEVRINNERCSGGSVEQALFTAGAWNITIETILGTLPDNATGLLFNINNAKFLLAVFEGAVECLYEGTAGALLRLIDRGTNLYSTELVTALASTFRKISGSGFCPSTGSFRGTFGLTPLQTITVR